MKLGITNEEYDALHVMCGGVCTICGQPETGNTPTKDGLKVLSVDHDHATGMIRGVLCNACNVALGKMRDDPDLLERAAAYLRSRKGKDIRDTLNISEASNASNTRSA